jgi:PAT family beta-lactamase induction signal transducer AmpG
MTAGVGGRIARFFKPMLTVFASGRMVIVLLMGFSSGLPLGLATGDTLKAWMTGAGVDLKSIGFFSLVGLPYTLKFLWSPLMDRFVPPFLGRRRGWMLMAQVAVVGGLAAMAFCSPAQHPWTLAAIAMTVAFFSASQDIAIDAYRTEILKPAELGAGASVAIVGYRCAMLVSTSAAMMLAGFLPWRTVYLLMAGAMGVGIVAALLGPEPELDVRPPQTLSQAVVLPFAEFLRRKGALEMLAFILIYKLDVFVAQAMTAPFILSIGFTTFDLGAVNNGFGLGATIAGGLIGGAMMARLGMFRALLSFGLLQGFSGLSYTLLAALGKHYPALVLAIAVENVCVGMGIAALTAFIMSLCDKRFTATQFALLTSLLAVSRVLAGVPTGWLAQHVGWVNYFIIATVIAAPGLLLLVLRYKTWELPGGPAKLLAERQSFR